MDEVDVDPFFGLNDDEDEGDDDNKFNNKKNKTTTKLERCDAKKCLLLTRCPSVLCCHVQRRYFDPSTNRMEKCVQFVEFPQTLDLSPYCAYGPRTSTPWAAGSLKPVCYPPPTTSPSALPTPPPSSSATTTTGTSKGLNGEKSTSMTNNENVQKKLTAGSMTNLPGTGGSNAGGKMLYRLQSIIEHRGNAYGGHYICYRKNHSTGIWHQISDANVTPISWKQVRNCQAYMLFYEAI